MALVLPAGPSLKTARAEPPVCQYGLAQAKPPPQFAAFSAVVRPGLPTAVDLRTAQDRRYRTMLEEDAEGGPNFAGHYTIASWGCGTACVQWAVIDAVSGRVTWPAGLSTISTAHVGGPSTDDRLPLRFRPDSRLLLVLGAPGEDASREGIAYYQWTGRALRRLRFLPVGQLCHPCRPRTVLGRPAPPSEAEDTGAVGDPGRDLRGAHDAFGMGRGADPGGRQHPRCRYVSHPHMRRHG